MIKWIILITIGLIVLGYLGFDIKKAIDAPATKSNLEYAKESVAYVWTKYLAKPAKFIFKEVIIKYIFKPIVDKIAISQGSVISLNTLINLNEYIHAG